MRISREIEGWFTGDADPIFIVFVAEVEQTVVGGLTAHVLDRDDTVHPSAYLYDIGVLPEQQRKGIGKMLINTLNEYCRANGFSEVFVQAEADDEQAVNFYHTTAVISVLQAAHFTYKLGIGT